jgi:subtilisin family serine protease
MSIAEEKTNQIRLRKISEIILMSLSIVIILLFFSQIGLTHDKVRDREKISADIGAFGQVRVIVKFSSPMLENLSTASRIHKVITPEGKLTIEKLQSAFDADQTLTREITSTGNGILAKISRTAFTMIHRYDTLPVLALNVSGESLNILENSPEVEDISPDKINFLPEPISPDNPRGQYQYSGQEIAEPQLMDTVNLIGASTVWSRGYSGSGWYVAILDTGIRKTHQFFYNKTIVEACFAAGQTGTGDCPNGTNTMYGPGAATHYPSNYSGYDHGTHVAGIAAGHTSDNSLNGIAKDANIIVVKIFSKFYNSSSKTYSVGAYDSDILKGLNYIYSLRNTYSIAAVNMSLGGGQYSSQSSCDSSNSATKAAIDNLKAVNIATVIATGNTGWCGYVSYPGCISSAISVGASSKTDTVASFSNSDFVMQDLFAPGISIYSSTGGSDSSYQYWSGTSMATPHITGAWAVLRQIQPSATVDQLLTAITATGYPVVTSCSGSYSKPRIQLDQAMGSLYMAPSVTTSQATNIDTAGATIDGMVNPNGLQTTYYFKWGTTTECENETVIQDGGSGISPAAVFFNLTGLTMSTTYHYRLVATNSAGSVYGSDVSFTTLGPPEAATPITPWGNTALSYPKISWYAVLNATQYNLIVNDSQGNKINQTYSASQVGCISGAGVCSVSPSVAFSTGPGSWQVQTQNANGLGPWSSVMPFTIVPSIAKMDFNADSRSDILLKNKKNGDVAVWLMNGTSLSSGQIIYHGMDLNWEIVGTGDFKNDSNADILLRNKANGDLAVWLMNGTSLSSGQIIYPGIDLNWQVAGTGDFNNDGKTDILWRNQISGDLAVWLMNGTSLSNGQIIYPGVDLIWQVAGTGNFNNDGKTDILWRNKVSGDVAVWLMEGTSLSSGQIIYRSVDLNWQIMNR